MARFSLEDLTTLTEDQGVKRTLDAHNVRLLRLVLRAFVAVSAVQVPMAFTSPPGAARAFRIAVALASLALVLFLVPVARRAARGCPPTKRPLLDEAARAFARVPRGAVLGYLYIQFVLVAAFTFFGDTKEPWFFIYPILLVFFRFAAAELVLLDTSIILTALVELLLDRLLGGRAFQPEFFTGLAFYNATVLAVALAVGARARKTVLAEWRDERRLAGEQIRMRQELELAREVQISMLPSRDPDLPWLEIASVSLPATEVGGDYYDYFTTRSGRLAVVVGDVAGHGLASGIVLSGVRSCLTLLAEELDHPAAVMERIHKMLRATSRHRMFVTLSILLLDREAGQATLTSAGHPPLLIRRASGEVEEALLPAFPLGAPLQAAFQERTIAFSPGDVFALQTDGLYEASGAGGSPYGLERLAAVLGRNGSGSNGATAQALRDGVLQDLAAFRGGATQEDDITLVVIRIL